MTEAIKAVINERLAELADCMQTLRLIQADAEREIEKVRARYADGITMLKDRVAALDKEIKGLSKANKALIFDGKDKAVLDHGILLYGKQRKVSIPRDALSRIKGKGWLDGIKVVESVNRPVVEQWPDERLAVIGARRRLVETFSYELKEM